MLLMVVLTMAGCRKKNVIPDDTLADIFHDAFVVNAYIGDMRMNIDSLHIYEPIFNRYGYTAKDVRYTVGNFSRRKSARLGSVVEMAISRLERESKEYARKVVTLDTISRVALREYTRTVYQDTLIRATKRADSTLLKIEISPIVQGEYAISYSYTCEDDLEKYPRIAEFHIYDENGYRNGSASVSLRSKGIVNRTIVARGDNRKLVLSFGKYIKPSEEEWNSVNKSDKKGGKRRKRWTVPKEQNLEIRNLRVVYKPNEEVAIDSLFHRYVDVKIFADGFLYKKDSLALSADSTRVSALSTPNN